MALTITKTGIEEIDRQHEQLLKCLADLLKYVETSYGYSACLTAIVALINYTQEHFAYEEKVLADAHYPMLDEHIAEHQMITKDVDRLWKEIEAGGEIGEALVQTIQHWIIEHINAKDQEFAEFLSGRA